MYLFCNEDIDKYEPEAVITCLIDKHKSIVIYYLKAPLHLAVKEVLFCNSDKLGGIFNALYTASIRINGMGIACVLMYTAPVFTAIASGIIFREKFSALKISALAVNIIGCILTVTGGSFAGSDVNTMGIIAGLGTGFCYGMAAVIGRLAGENADAFIVSMYSFLFAMISVIVIMRPDISPALSDSRILGLGFLYGLIPTSLSYAVYYDGLKKIPDTGKVPVIASIEPVTAVLIGMLIYNERIGAANFIGVAVVLISIIIMAKAK